LRSSTQGISEDALIYVQKKKRADFGKGGGVDQETRQRNAIIRTALRFIDGERGEFYRRGQASRNGQAITILFMERGRYGGDNLADLKKYEF